LAALLGPRLNDFPMYQIVDLGIGATGQAMGALRSIRLLRETEDRMEFVNELIRGHTYSSIPKPMRTALHGEVVARLLDADVVVHHLPIAPRATRDDASHGLHVPILPLQGGVGRRLARVVGAHRSDRPGDDMRW